MKRLLFVMAPIVALAFAPSLSAQTFEIIPQIGLTLTDYSGDDVDASIAAGFSAGGKVRFGRTFYVDGGFFWSWAGANVTSDLQKDNLYIGSIQIPVTIGYRLINAKIVALRLFAGVLPSFVTNVSTDFDVDKDDVKGVLWSGKFGAGVDVLIFAFDVAYQPGFTNIFEDSVGAGDVKQNSWIVEAGVRFGF